MNKKHFTIATLGAAVTQGVCPSVTHPIFLPYTRKIFYLRTSCAQTAE